MKVLNLKFAVIYLLLGFVSLALFAQRSNGIAVQGKINVQQGSVEGAAIRMFQDGRRLDDYGVGADGTYKVELNYNHKYELIFIRKDNFPQKIVIESAVPNSVLQSDPKFPPFPLDINLFTEIPGIDRRFSENTVLKIYYSPNVDNFISELYYNDAQIAKLIEQAVLQAQMIGKESDYLSKLTRAELAELRKEYNELLEQARKEYSDEKFLAALDGFKAASKILPNEQFPKDRIAEINDLLGIMMVAADLDKALSERFTALIKEGDLLFSQTKYNDAKNSYNRALSIRPNDNYANQQIKKINELLKQLQSEDQYKELIAQADVSFDQMLYNEALTRYNSALELKNNEPYPKSKIEEINEILAKQSKDAEKQESYKEAVFQAEAMFEKQFYDKSITFYETALKIKPGDERALRKIDEVKAVMKEIADKMMFDNLVKNADKLYKKQQLTEALTDYSGAADLFPKDAYVVEKIKEINAILKLNENFADLVFKADNQFNTQYYPGAKSLYNQALEIRNDDKHSLDRIKEIDGILALQNLDEKYNSVLAEADKSFNDKNFDNALAKFNEALVIKPKEKYAKDKITEITGIVQQIAKTDADYQKAIARADGLFQQKDFEKAKTAFADAGKIKPSETYPAEMIVKIDAQVAEQDRLAAAAEAERVRLAQEAAAAEAARLAAIQAEKDKNYSDAVARADEFYNQKEYEKARAEYRTAQGVKPGETYPQQKIDEIGTLLAQLSAAQKAYEDALKIADREMKAEKFDAAKTAFNNAKQAKPDETYPGEMLAKIDSIVETRTRLAAEAEAERVRVAQEAAAAEAARLAAIQSEKDKNYSDAVARADEFYNQKEYEKARAEYRTAQGVKPGETYPQQKIDEIGKTIAALEQARKEKELTDKNYLALILQADRFFTAKNYTQSKGKYNEALVLKAEETYPKERIIEIEKILEQQALDEKYRTIILVADGFFKTTTYLQAKEEYQKALEIKPAEAYPKNQISRIDDLLQKEQQKVLAEKNTAEDLQRRTNEIAVLNEQLDANNIDSQAELDALYNQLIQQADELFDTKQYNISRGWYYKAWDVKPKEIYPPQRIAEINRIVGSMLNSQLDRDYQRYVDLADSTFRENQLAVSRGWYNRALSVKGNEKYPKDQLTEIERKIAGQIASQSGQQFDLHVSKAENAFNEKNYNIAHFWYRKALELRPNDAEVKQKLLEIQEVMK